MRVLFETVLMLVTDSCKKHDIIFTEYFVDTSTLKSLSKLAQMVALPTFIQKVPG
jgi:hypothetical protein